MCTAEHARRFATGKLAKAWRELSGMIGADDAAWLVALTARLDPPERIESLAVLERKQNALGAGFYGLLPEQISDPLPVPVDDAQLLAAASQMARIRRRNLDAVGKAMPRYPLSFCHAPFPSNALSLPDGWCLDVDLSAVESLLEALAQGHVDDSEAGEIAAMPALHEMLRHRRDLGYVPEPVIDEAGVAWCLVHAASSDPLDLLWIWLHPCNFFGLADLRSQLGEYHALMATLREEATRLAALILDPLERHAPCGMSFQDQLSLAIGWGIAGWATAVTAGINIEHFKDHYDALLTTLRHEVFHRLQLKLCPSDPTADPDSFAGIVSGGMESVGDEMLHRGIAYSVLEGSATFVSGADQAIAVESLSSALDLLQRLAAVESIKEGDALLNEGLRSNGPFYGFGVALSRTIAENQGPRALGEALAAGAPAFALRALEHPDFPGSVARSFVEKVRNLTR